jgi:hypothetical protein
MALGKQESSNHSGATPYFRVAEIVESTSIDHRKLSKIGTTSSGRRKGEVITPPNMVYVLDQTPTTSIPLDPHGARGWQVVPALV